MCIRDRGEYEQAVALKIAFKNSGLMDDLMVHEVIDYNKAFTNAANAANSVVKPGKWNKGEINVNTS